jgi:myo-inositol-1(or 4)-monophosphatase
MQSAKDSASERLYLTRIETALAAACQVARKHTLSGVKARLKNDADIVTDADHEISAVLREQLLRPKEGWLSEEDPDDFSRLSASASWIVDPLDGTREFVDGVPECAISVGLVIDGVAIAGGIVNPFTGERILGSLNNGVTYNGKPATISGRKALEGSTILASRREYSCGDWERFEIQQLCIRPVGSIAYKLALVAAGLAEATWTLQPRSLWDVAAGIALVNSAGGRTSCTRKARVAFDQDNTRLPGLVASAPGVWNQIVHLIDAKATPEGKSASV